MGTPEHERTEEFRPRIVAVELTLRCNARCIHCGSAAGAPRENELSAAAFAALFEDVACLGGEEICLLGGEPFLHPDWFGIGASAGDRGLSVVFITNGAPVDRGLVDKLRRMPGLSRVAVSLDGACPEVHDAVRGRPGSFREALGALERLQDASIEAGVITTVMRRNLGELEAIRDLLLGRGLGWQVQTVGTGGRQPEESLRLVGEDFHRVGRFLHDCRRRFSVKDLPVAGAHDVGYFSTELENYGEMPQELWRGCPAGTSVAGVTSNGGVKACLSLPDGWIEGRLRERSFADLWRDETLFARNRRFDPARLTGACASCDVFALCRAGCLEMCLSTTGTPFENLNCFRRIERRRRAKKGSEKGSVL